MKLRPTYATIDTGALVRNLNTLRAAIPPGVRTIAVVKANAYGHDVSLCVPALMGAGIDVFGVATIEEAETLRALAPRQRIVVLSPPPSHQLNDFVRLDVEPFISTYESALALASTAETLGRGVRVHLYVDTGMARDGVPVADALQLLLALRSVTGLSIVGLASHFATSDEPEVDWSYRQLQLFEGVVREATASGFTFDMIHLANSGGILNVAGSCFTAVRPGLALYGYHPTPERQGSSGLVPVLGLSTTVSNVTHYPADTPVSYGRRWTTRQPTRIATLPIGYADGLMRCLSNNVDVLVGGRRRPVVGTICMDEVMVDLDDDQTVSVGSHVVIIGTDKESHIDAWELARRAGTIPYEICTNLSARVPRVGVPQHPDASGIRTGKHTS